MPVWTYVFYPSGHAALSQADPALLCPLSIRDQLVWDDWGGLGIQAAAGLHLEIQSSQGNSSAYKKTSAMNSEFDAAHSKRDNGRLTDFHRHWA